MNVLFSIRMSFGIAIKLLKYEQLNIYMEVI